MSGSDSIHFNALEKPSAQDHIDAQAMLARSLADVLRHFSQTRIDGIWSTTDTETVRPVVGGLQVTPNGSNVQVQPGVLLQDSASLTPTPSTYDSNYRMAFVRSAQSVTAPAPASNTFYVLEAQMSESIASETRSVLDTVTGEFSNTSVQKRKTRGITTQWLAGTTTSFPAPSGGNWVPLAGVFRPAGGGAVQQAHIYDLRMFLGSRNISGEEHKSRWSAPRVSYLRATDTEDVWLNVEEAQAGSGAVRLEAQLLLGGSPVGFSPGLAAVKDTTTTVSASNWYYLYLCSWNGLAPRMYYKENTGASVGLETRGILVLSSVAPTAFGSMNGGTLNLPAPWASTVSTGNAQLVGILRRNASNTGWVSVVGGNGTYRFSQQAAAPGISLASGTTAPMNVTGLPAGTKMLKFAVNLNADVGTVTSGQLQFFVRPTGGGASSNYVLLKFAVPEITATRAIINTFEIDVPYDSTGYDFTVSGASTLNEFEARLIGYTT